MIERKMSDSVKAWGLMAGSLLMLFAVLLVWTRITGAVECLDLDSQTPYKTKFSVLSGCYVEVDGRWVPRDSWRGEQEK
jgi:hypothetical protein